MSEEEAAGCLRSRRSRARGGRDVRCRNRRAGQSEAFRNTYRPLFGSWSPGRGLWQRRAHRQIVKRVAP